MSWKAAGIEVQVLGDAPPFSKSGRNSSYRVKVGERVFLVDCGAPIFRLLTPEEIGGLTGVIATHSHADHHRWLADLALYRFHVLRGSPPLQLLTTEEVHREYEDSCRAQLELTLTPASDRIISHAHNEFFDCRVLGPRARYRIVAITPAPGARQMASSAVFRAEDVPGGAASRAAEPTPGAASRAATGYAVVDRAGRILGPDRAKVVIGGTGVRPRLLFKDPEEGVWVEPAVYYAQSDPRFYEAEEQPYADPATGLRLRACRDHCWHGPATMGVLVERGEERVLFGADTVYHPQLWKRLVEERPVPTRGGMTLSGFEAAAVVSGDINDFIECVWSPQRYEAAMGVYRDTVVFQDTAAAGSIVHTDYVHLRELRDLSRPRRIICVHTPDRFVATEPLSFPDKVYRALDGDIYEEVDGELHLLDGDVYFKEHGAFFVGHEDPAGGWAVVERLSGILDVVPFEAGGGHDGKLLWRCRLLQDLHGRHFPRLEDPSEEYRVRADGLVEILRTSAEGSSGAVVSPLPRARREAPRAAPQGAGHGG